MCDRFAVLMFIFLTLLVPVSIGMVGTDELRLCIDLIAEQPRIDAGLSRTDGDEMERPPRIIPAVSKDQADVGRASGNPVCHSYSIGGSGYCPTAEPQLD